MLRPTPWMSKCFTHSCQVCAMLGASSTLMNQGTPPIRLTTACPKIQVGDSLHSCLHELRRMLSSMQRLVTIAGHAFK
jgi:hypothetical protein